MANNPVTPIYAKSIPKTGCGLARSYNMLYIPSFVNLIKDVEVTTNDPQIRIIDNSNSVKDSFEIDFSPKEDLTGVLAMVLKESDTVVAAPVLKGRTIDEVNLSWTWNKDISQQILSTDDVEITNPTLSIADRSYDYTGESITENTVINLQGNDGSGLDGAIANLAQTVRFGNYYYRGHGASLFNGAVSAVQAFLDSLSKSIETSKVKNLFGTGGNQEFFFFAYPKSLGLPSDIKKGIFSGGYVRLINVAGSLKTSLGDGETELDITVSNGLTSEAYYLFQSLYDNQNDPNQPIEIT